MNSNIVEAVVQPFIHVAAECPTRRLTPAELAQLYLANTKGREAIGLTMIDVSSPSLSRARVSHAALRNNGRDF